MTILEQSKALIWLSSFFHYKTSIINRLSCCSSLTVILIKTRTIDIALRNTTGRQSNFMILTSSSAEKFFHSPGTRILLPANRGEPVFAASLHKEQSCASVLFNPLSSMSFSIISFHLFFGWSFFEPSTTNFFAFTGAFSSPFFSHAQTIAISALLKIPPYSPFLPNHELFRCLMPSLNVFPQIIRNFLILVLSNSHWILSSRPSIGTTALDTSHTTFTQASSQLQPRKSFRQYACYILKFCPSRSYSCSDSFLHSFSRADEISHIWKLFYSIAI